MNKRRKYAPNFKIHAVLLTHESGKTVSEVAKNLGIRKDLLYRWRREYQNSQKNFFSCNRTQALTPKEKKIKELEKKLRDAVLERDILKKAVAIISKTQNK